MGNSNISDTKDIIQEISECDIGERIRIAEFTDSEPTQSLFHLIAFFNTLGILNLKRNESEEWEITIEHKAQRYFLKSISQFVEEDLTVFRAWEEGRKDLITPTNIFYGTQFLHYLERERKEAVKNPTSLRTGTVVKAIVKANFDYKKEPLYLFEYDRKAEQYKLIGGLIESHDVNKKKALEREIDEEIPRVEIELGEDYYLKHLDKFEDDVVSFTYGAYSTYTIHYYLVDFVQDTSFELTNHNKWLSMDEIEKKRSKDGNEIFPLTHEVRSLLERQPMSLKISGSFSPVSFVKSYWQEIVGIITILSFIVGVLTLVL